ncbi:MAG TPA: hypothetical protein VLM37_12010 [Fibrobacteraceae bacterium]|nr:hypothetical protein [Fibrobacteraceae bacterium]
MIVRITSKSIFQVLIPYCVLLLWGRVQAQDDSLEPPWTTHSCDHPLLDQALRLDADVRALDLDGHWLHLQVTWKHSSAVDSFWIVRQGHLDSMLYVNDGWMRTLRGPMRGVCRAMAFHHLRERIYNTTLRFDDLELLAKGHFQCRDSAALLRSLYRTSQSAMWYSFRVTADSILCHGLNGVCRTLKLSDWWVLPGGRELPSHLHLEEGWLAADIRVSSYTLPESLSDPLLFWKPWRLRAFLNEGWSTGIPPAP